VDLSIFSLSGKTALITGSGQGLGLAMARGLAGAGARILLNGRTQTKLEKARNLLAEEISDVGYLHFDVTDHDAVREAIDRYESEEGPIDILVNNAGLQHRERLDTLKPEIFEAVMKANISSVFNVGQAVAHHMIERGNGRIINIASVQAALARATIAPYVASKGAVVNLTKGMATDWGPLGLNVNAIAPGYFRTELTQKLVNDPEFSSWLAERTPLGRWGDVHELSGACIFLASDAASFVNGHTLYVDGGISCRL